jgi:hypothetical protein
MLALFEQALKDGTYIYQRESVAIQWVNTIILFMLVIYSIRCFVVWTSWDRQDLDG